VSDRIHHSRTVPGRRSNHGNMLPVVSCALLTCYTREPHSRINSVDSSQSSRFSYYSTYSTIEHFSSSVLFVGCISTYDSKQGVTAVLARANNTDLSATSLKN